jgi:hypothetical protein
VSYDFAALLPECAGETHTDALEAAARVYGDAGAADPDPRLREFVAALMASGAGDEGHGWLSIKPLDVQTEGVAVPTTYGAVTEHLITLLRLCAAQGLWLVDLSAAIVHPPGPGVPVGVMAGGGTYLGAVTAERLAGLAASLPLDEPWIVLERADQTYAQARRGGSGWELEHRDGGPDRHFATIVADEQELVERLWGWVEQRAGWGDGLRWSKLDL